ncbi:MAG TPA: hypothetical protein VKL99_12210, partial [Candidatus Angelobacter sp.]|nr:hypothetical protein [Candidatus Angelobacter sp.]
MHTWLATGLMGRAIRSTSTSSRQGRTCWLRRTLTLMAVMAVLAFALPMATAQQGQPATPSSSQPVVAPAQSPAVVHEQGPARPAPQAGGEANLRLPDMK